MSENEFMKPVNVCFKSMQGRLTIVSEQNAMLRRLAESLKILMEVEAQGPVSLRPVDDSERDTLGGCSVTRKRQELRL